MLRDRLLKENKGKLVLWLQQVLIECCYIKLNLLNDDRQSFPIMEPISHHCICKTLLEFINFFLTSYFINLQ
jgi:timeless